MGNKEKPMIISSNVYKTFQAIGKWELYQDDNILIEEVYWVAYTRSLLFPIIFLVYVNDIEEDSCSNKFSEANCLHIQSNIFYTSKEKNPRCSKI